MSKGKLSVMLALMASSANAASSLAGIKHVVMIMMENRSFQHYFGTMAGVRGFADPNVQMNGNRSVWYQDVTGLTDKADYLLPYWLNYEQSEENYNKSQCLCAGANNWIPTQQAMNNGLNNMWPKYATPQSWGYFKRQDIAYHFALAESYTVGDMYHAAITSNTDPNRWYWQSGTINVPGGKTPLGAGGVVLDDNQANGCVATNLDCLPLQWPAFAQYLDEAGIDWRSFQNSWDWATNNGLFYFQAFQEAAVNSSLYQRGLAFDGDNGLDAFRAAAAAGTLPEVSWAFPPGSLQEHPPNTPQDGAWWINQIVDAAIHGKDKDDTVILLNWDEGGGWGDAVLPIISPKGTPGEWFEDPYGQLGYTFSGPGIRIPLIMISPYTRGGHVFTERGDHSSILLFLEQYLAARGYSNITAKAQMSDWRREHQSNLVNAFDFENLVNRLLILIWFARRQPDFSIPDLPQPATPIANANGQLIGMYNGFCNKVFGGSCSSNQYTLPIPYGSQTEEEALFFEDGYKGVRGALTEGRYLVFEANGYALYNPSTAAKQFAATRATPGHEDIHQRWVLHALTPEGSTFHVTSAVDGKYLSQHSSLSISESGAETYNITYLGNSRYAMRKENGAYLNIKADGTLSFDSTPTGYNVFSVTYHN
ncbi:non-hemolytic phospholipase c [Niveomyces insectorum RCEF 264]|uniref:Non-hemolytic phospholipase c n=1 Tax=Niveomyces insectorum RCEF 264 TaxID=1081102 RepID=A0A167Q904_9HYPO|nr:non-hemolytic phospholipase c [Niveomyces insectorum RCEF 264]